jgi:dolichol-phosphate mannosyltransferase
VFVLPAYNEEKSLGELLDRIDGSMAALEQEYRVLVVDDGSADDTPAIAEGASRELPVTLVVNPRNLGLGATIARGLRIAAEEADPEDAICTMDADLTQDPCYLGAMVEAFRAGGDVVIASRFCDASRVSGVSLFRRVMTRGARIVLGVLMPVQGVRDYSCGFRLYSAEVLQRAFADLGDEFIHERGFACMAEILVKLRKRACFAEVPFELHYEEKRKASTMRVWRTVLAYFDVVVRTRWQESRRAA